MHSYRLTSLLAVAAGLAVGAGSPLPASLAALATPVPPPREPRRFAHADAERLAKAEAKRARKAARRARAAKEDPSNASR